MNNNIRNYLTLLEEHGEISKINEEVDWKYEIADKTRVCQRLRSKPALLFENIKGYLGHKVFTNGLGSFSKVALALGLDPKSAFNEIVLVFKQRILNPIEPVMVADGDFLKHIFTGIDIDLAKLPVPWWNRKDGGRYIGTWHLNISKDIETGNRNIGIYRMQLLDKRTTALSISPNSHLAIHLSKAEKEGRQIEMAVAIGVDETLIMAGAGAFPYETDEFCIAGGIKLSPIELVKCKTVYLEVPASAEIILEGKIDPKRKVKEGPFLDYAGVPSINPEGYVFEVSCMMYRNDPVFRGTAVGVPGAEDHILSSLLASADCLDFHGSKIRQKIQNLLVRRALYRPFQYVGRVGKFIKQRKKTLDA